MEPTSAPYRATNYLIQARRAGEIMECFKTTGHWPSYPGFPDGRECRCGLVTQPELPATPGKPGKLAGVGKPGKLAGVGKPGGLAQVGNACIPREATSRADAPALYQT